MQQSVLIFNDVALLTCSFKWRKSDDDYEETWEGRFSIRIKTIISSSLDSRNDLCYIVTISIFKIPLINGLFLHINSITISFPYRHCISFIVLIKYVITSQLICWFLKEIDLKRNIVPSSMDTLNFQMQRLYRNQAQVIQMWLWYRRM